MNTHVAQGVEYVVLEIPGEVSILRLEAGLHLSTVHPFSTHDDYGLALEAARLLDPEYDEPMPT